MLQSQQNHYPALKSNSMTWLLNIKQRNRTQMSWLLLTFLHQTNPYKQGVLQLKKKSSHLWSQLKSIKTIPVTMKRSHPPTLAEVRKAINTLTRFVDYKGNEDSVRRCMEFSGMVTSLTIEANNNGKSKQSSNQSPNDVPPLFPQNWFVPNLAEDSVKTVKPLCNSW